MPKSLQAAAEGLPKIIPFPAGADAEAREDVVTDLAADMIRLSSVLKSLLEDRIRDTGKGPLTIARKDAADVQFIARQASDTAERLQKAWEAV
ncbi:hypothetical protein [Rhizobium alvei]|uniref:Uncharacterized protein n=1 Tax=Rhizobium alvei TaxID=1132659 RepID=A0ABT8YKH1_9HYPH|nr:hypothetical protein [Rhizobium alvei]MDO6963997.1 hypothetical protein [Rhizobium alvei]